MGKGSTRRPCMVPTEEFDLRWERWLGQVTEDEFNKRLKKIRDKENGL